jgi:hypothetical protein
VGLWEAILSEDSIKPVNGDETIADYAFTDLKYFQSIVQRVMRDIEEKSSTPEDRQWTELQVATSLFEIAKSGKRDFAGLKQQVLAALDARRRPN